MSQNSEGNLLPGRPNGIEGMFVFDIDGYCLGFIPKNYATLQQDTIILGPDDAVALVILRGGTLQNPDGTPSEYTDPIQYLLDRVTSRNEWIGPPVNSDGQFFLNGTEQYVVDVANLKIGQRLYPNDRGLFLLLGATLADIQSFETLIAGLLANLDSSSSSPDTFWNCEKVVTQVSSMGQIH